jgi:hypothetical protein
MSAPILLAGLRHGKPALRRQKLKKKAVDAKPAGVESLLASGGLFNAVG